MELGKDDEASTGRGASSSAGRTLETIGDIEATRCSPVQVDSGGSKHLRRVNKYFRAKFSTRGIRVSASGQHSSGGFP